MLNLFFPVLAGLLILLAGKAKTERCVLLYALGAGLSLFLFQWWYDRAGFTLAYFMVLVFGLFVQQIRFRTILVSAFLFVLCAQPATFLSGTGAVQGFLKNYFTIGSEGMLLAFNHLYTTSFGSGGNIGHGNMNLIKKILSKCLNQDSLESMTVLEFQEMFSVQKNSF